MKFGKELQRVMDMSDPEWAPYWLNYKVLKRLIKGLDTRAPPPIAMSSSAEECPQRVHDTSGGDGPHVDMNDNNDRETRRTAKKPPLAQPARTTTTNPSNNIMGQEKGKVTHQPYHRSMTVNQAVGKTMATRQSRLQTRKMLSRHPGEVIFFKLMHAEVSKAKFFFEQTTGDLRVREAHIAEEMTRYRDPESGHHPPSRQDILALRGRIQLLHRDLLRLEAFAIMTYCGISKILKKHDKATRFTTQHPFMAKVVQPANFSSYPWLLQMTERCERWLMECCNMLQNSNSSQHEEDNQKEHIARPDEARLFMDMIDSLHRQRKRTLQISQQQSASSSNDDSSIGHEDYGYNAEDEESSCHSSNESLPPLKKPRLRL